jgi:hypothetical protein
MDNRQTIEHDGKRYILAITRARCVAVFLQCFGCAPGKTVKSGKLWLAGPVDESARRGRSGAGRASETLHTHRG